MVVQNFRTFPVRMGSSLNRFRMPFPVFKIIGQNLATLLPKKCANSGFRTPRIVPNLNKYVKKISCHATHLLFQNTLQRKQFHQKHLTMHEMTKMVTHDSCTRCNTTRHYTYTPVPMPPVACNILIRPIV